MRLQTQWLRWVVGVLTLTTALLFTPAPIAFAQTSLFDPSFTFSSGANDSAYAIAVQNDGKILVGGYFAQGDGTGLLRLNSDGQIDQSFAGQTDGSVLRLLKQPDGKILVAGSFTILQGIPRRGIGRLLPSGEVDPSFDAGILFEPYQAAFALGLQSDGKILVSMESTSSQNLSAGLVRINSNGQIDNSFVQTNIFDSHYIFAIVPRTDGSILLGGGFQGVNGSASPGLALVSTNGEVNASFTCQLKTNSLAGVYAIAEQPDQSLLIGGGFWREGMTNRLVLAKLTPGLAWDTDFHPDVIDPTPGIFYSGESYVMSVVRQSDGKLLLGGKFQEVGGHWRQSVARVSAEGRVDPCFDPGMGLYPYQHVFGVNALALQSDGKVLVAGSFFNPMSSSHRVTRLLPQSECDTMRVHLNMKYEIVGGTCPPGGTNHLEWSTNCVDWTTAMSSTMPYVFSTVPSTLYDRLFFRVRKEY